MNDKAFELIEALAKKLGVAAEYLFATFVRQTVISGVVWAVVEVLGAMVFIYAAYKITTYTIKNNEDLEDNDTLGYWITGAVITCILGIVFFFTLIFDTPTQIMKVITPEYYAVKDIMSTVTKGE